MIELENIVVKYGNNTVIDNLNLKIQSKNFFTLLGASGCGKSTLLKLIAGFIKPTQGRVVIDGKDVTHISVEQRGIGIVFQNYALFPNLTVFENVAFGLRVKKTNKVDLTDRVNETLKMVGILEHANKKPTELSGGQQQRVAIARSLVLNPSILLMDEPLSNLDAKLRIVMRNEIKRLQKQLGFTTIFVTHDQEEAMSMSDNIALLNRGVIEQVGSPQTLYEHPTSPFVCDFIGESHPLTLEIQTLLDKEMGAGVFVRPERLRILNEQDDSYDYNLKARITDIIYKGPLTSVVTVAGYTSDISAIAPSYQIPNVAVGENIIVAFNHNDVIQTGARL